MMKKLRFGVLVFLFAVFGNSVSGAGIAVSLTGFQIDSLNVSFGYTLTVNAKVTNTDSTTFSGVLDFGLRNSTDTLSSFDIFGKPPYSGNQITLNPNEAVPAVFRIRIDQPHFISGPDVVVVWPIVAAPVEDSILIHINIEDPSGISENEQKGFTYIMLNDKIILNYLTNESIVKQVRIFDVSGRQISQFHSDFITEIPVPNLPKGIYLCEVITFDNRIRVIKFWR